MQQCGRTSVALVDGAKEVVEPESGLLSPVAYGGGLGIWHLWILGKDEGGRAM